MKLLAFTGSRAEYYLQRPLFKELLSRKEVSLDIIVSGGILSESRNQTLQDIYSDGFNSVFKVSFDESIENCSHSGHIARLVLELEPLISRINPQACLVYADRFESFAFALTAFHLDQVVIHCESGDLTEGGTYDDQIRHCISKLSHIQLTSTLQGLQVLSNLGEEAWRSKCVGLLSYDSMNHISLTKAQQVSSSLDLDENSPLVIATLHPISGDISRTKIETTAFFQALANLANEYQQNHIQILITAPNNDKYSEYIRGKISHLLHLSASIKYIESLGGYRYHSLLSLAQTKPVIVAGNSSSIIKEAPYFGAHAVNVGQRQAGREKASSQIDVLPDAQLIYQAILNCSKSICRVGHNPYLHDKPSYNAASFILQTLSQHTRKELLSKKFTLHANVN